MSVVNELEKAFHPRSIAVVGASENPFSAGSPFTLHLKTYGYRGEIYPINPRKKEVFGIKCYASLKEISGPIDYVICCISASQIFDLLDECHQKGVGVLHMFTGRFSETGISEAASLEQEILERARELGIRIIGPNCMGLYYPKEGISFAYDLPKDSGPVGMLSQSGGLAGEFVRFASLRNIRFSKSISYGNALDITESDLLEYFVQDFETEVIACYIEGVNDGVRFFSALREAANSKPVVVLKAGRSPAGTKAASSHTGALAGSSEIWDMVIKQSGAIQVQSFEEMIDVLAGLCFLPPVFGRRIGVVGGGGGVSVLSADGWGEAGFDLVPLPDEMRAMLRERVPEMWWNWIGNPVDVSLMPESAWISGLIGDMLRMMIACSDYDLVIGNVSMGGPFGKDQLITFVEGQANDVMEVAKKSDKPVAVVLDTAALCIEDFEDWRWRLFAEQRSRFVAAHIPVFSSITEAANTIRKLVDYYQRRKIVSSKEPQDMSLDKG